MLKLSGFQFTLVIFFHSVTLGLHIYFFIAGENLTHFIAQCKQKILIKHNSGEIASQNWTFFLMEICGNHKKDTTLTRCLIIETESLQALCRRKINWNAFAVFYWGMSLHLKKNIVYPPVTSKFNSTVHLPTSMSRVKYRSTTLFSFLLDERTLLPWSLKSTVGPIVGYKSNNNK